MFYGYLRGFRLYYLLVVVVVFNDRVWWVMFFIVKIGVLLYSDILLIIIYCFVMILIDIKIFLWINVIFVFDLICWRIGGCIFGELLSFWIGNSYEF